jgi:hypothetical protein
MEGWSLGGGGAEGTCLSFVLRHVGCALDRIVGLDRCVVILGSGAIGMEL